MPVETVEGQVSQERHLGMDKDSGLCHTHGDASLGRVTNVFSDRRRFWQENTDVFYLFYTSEGTIDVLI